MKVLFSATDESVRVETGTSGHNEEAHANANLLTPEIKKEIKKWAVEGLKPKKIRLKLIVILRVILTYSTYFKGKLWR